VNTPVLGRDGSVRYVIHQVEDVTCQVLERRRATHAEAEHIRCLQLADAIPGLVFETDTDARNIYVNEQFLEYTGLPLQQLLNDGWCHSIHPDEREAVVDAWCEALQSGQNFERECRIRSAAGEWRWFVVRGRLLRDSMGRVERAIGICTDITEQQNRHDFQQLLMRELSHRVKNSLSLVSALLHLQSRNLDGASRAALEDASSRVHAVATVHDQLWRQADTRQIDLKEFLTNLAAALAAGAPSHRTTVEVERTIVSADLAVPIGLLVNELVTNAYKYAYPAGKEGEVRIVGRRSGKNEYAIEVSDSGAGLPPGFDLARSGGSLGMRVISTLAKQLDATITTGSARPGARFVINIPLD
jgi:PAS domain S-box-containing protein